MVCEKMHDDPWVCFVIFFLQDTLRNVVPIFQVDSDRNVAHKRNTGINLHLKADLELAGVFLDFFTYWASFRFDKTGICVTPVSAIDLPAEGIDT